MKHFDVAQVPLAGWNLLEANAGTGKTFSICMLYLRLLLERELDHEAIVVITFTRIATAELRSRIVETLGLAEAMVSGISAEPADSPVSTICRPFAGDPAALSRLQRARAAFDLAPILTIHGFCQRLLGDYSLTTGFDPDLELIENEKLLLEPLLGQLWAEVSQSFSPDFAHWLQTGPRERVRRLAAQIQRLLDKPAARFDGPDFDAAGAARVEARLASQRRQLAPLWHQEQSRIRDIINHHPRLNRSAYKAGRITVMFDALERFLDGQPLSDKGVKALALLTASVMREKTKAGVGAPPEHEFFRRFEPCYETLHEQHAGYREREKGLVLELLPQVQARYRQFKLERGLITYSDLVSSLAQALAKPSDSAAMIEAVQQRYGAALIDEFQDTDQQQFEIFDRLFGRSPAAVWLVGDPKQALYGFRGADVFAYLQARQRAQCTYQLTTDWRAGPDLVACTNALFSRHENPFVVAGIEFAPATAAGRRHRRVLVNGEPLAAMRCQALGGDKGKSLLQNEAAAACADEIVRLLKLAEKQQAQIDDGDEQRALQAADIAILVRNRSQATIVARELNLRQLACVQPSVQDVFDSRQARQLERLLQGILNCDMPDRVAGAAATELIGAGARELAAVRDEDDRAERLAEQFDGWRRVWQGQGLAALLVAVLSETGAAARILPQPQGRRSLSNWFQLVELLEAHLPSASHSCAEQIGWLNSRRQGADGTSAEALERLESQTDVVRIVTIHGAKGDQYPLTFCPFLWHESARNQSPAGYLECHEGDQLVMDFGSARFGDRQALQQREKLSENVRIAYVALTRAICSSWMAWGVAADTQLAGLHHLLDAHSGASAADATRSDVAGRHMQVLEQIGARCLPLHRPSSRIMTTVTRFGQHQTAQRIIRPHWQVSSYSSLFGNQGGPRDADELIADSAPGAPGAHSANSSDKPGALPTGARTGLMVHELLEKLPSFNLSPGELSPHVRQALSRYGMSEDYTPPLTDMIDRLLTLRLGPVGLRLCEIGPQDQIRELEFHLDAPGAAAEAIWKLVRGVASATPWRGASGGFLRGFVDLVVRCESRYFIVDYKTNDLGRRPADYAGQALTTNVLQHQYDLQYHLYTLALHRMLLLLMPGYDYSEHFGGVLYLYLRGLDEAGAGVYFARPAAAVIESLDGLIRT